VKVPTTFAPLLAAFSAVVVSAALVAPALAQSVPPASPAPAATAAPIPLEKMRLSNPRFDPCGGYQEILTKYLVGTPCVYNANEGLAGVKYVGAGIPVDTKLIVNGKPYENSTSAGIIAAPNEEVMAGIGNRMMLTYYGPSYAQLWASGSVPSPLAAGTVNQQFMFKQLVYFNPKGSFLGTYQFVYKPPTGSPGLDGGGPVYKINGIIQWPVMYKLALCINMPFMSAPHSSENEQTRVWAFVPSVGLTWRSPGATMTNTVLAFNSISGQVSLINIVTQEFSRRFALNFSFAYNDASTGDDINNLVSVSNTTHTYAFELGAAWQFGENEIFSQ
jgi:hypothetical protein